MNAGRFLTILVELHKSSSIGIAHMKYLTAKELVERWKNEVVIGTLANWRSKRQGPPFIKLGSKVLYPLDKLEDWERLQLQSLQAANDNTTADDKAA